MNEVNEVYIHDTATPTTVLAKPEHVASLATSCVTITPHVKVWSGTQQDDGIAYEVTTSKQATSESGKFIKNLLAGDSDHKNILRLRQKIYNMVKRHTYDWAGTTRILPAVSLPVFNKEFDEIKQEFNDAVDSFLQAYPSKVSNMAFASSGLGSMFRAEDYPTVEELRSKFYIGVYISEVPTGDFRCQVSADLAQDLHDHYQRTSQRMVEDIYMQQREQLRTVLQSISHACEVEIIEENGVTKVRRRKLYDSTMEKAQSMVEVFKDFNPLANNGLEEARVALGNALKGKTVAGVRNSDGERDLLKAQVDDILSKF